MPESLYQLYPIVRVDTQGRHEESDAVVCESVLELYCNRHKVASLPCLASDLRYLAVGYLHSRGLVPEGKEITSITIDSGASGCHRAHVRLGQQPASADNQARAGTPSTSSEVPAKKKGGTRVPTSLLIQWLRNFEKASPLFKRTGAAHSCGLYDANDTCLLFEDILRLNAADKLVGYCLVHGFKAAGKVLLVSGRVSADMLARAIKLQAVIIASPSAPTDRAIQQATQHTITLVGFARGKRLNIYTHPRRLS